MDAGAWTTIGVFVAMQVITLVGVVVALKSDSKTLREQIVEMKTELKKLADVVIAQALQDQRIRAIEERQILGGRRMDELQTRLNRYVDKVAFQAMEDTNRED
jgi:hypothetical protein